MPLKAVPCITPVSSAGNDTGMAGTLELDLQVVTIGQLRAFIKQINKG